MDIETTIGEARAFAREELGGDSSGHDWWHVRRVAALAKRIALEEGADVHVCELAALLHDVADEKLNASKEAGETKLRLWLDKHFADGEASAHVMDIIATMSYSGGHNPPMKTPEGRVVQDADRLDALGAIGIARTFAYAGWKGQLMHDPDMLPREGMTKEEYRQRQGTAVNHFYEKLLKLKDLMNTTSGRRLAEERHRYMEAFLRQFADEWDAVDEIGQG